MTIFSCIQPYAGFFNLFTNFLNMSTLIKKEDFVYVVVFTLGNEEYGMCTTVPPEVTIMTEITPMIGMPDYVLGNIKIDGNTITIVDLERRFHLEHTSKVITRHIVVIKIDEITLGVVVDQVLEVLYIPISKIQPSRVVVSSKIHNHCLSNMIEIGSRFIVLMDLDKIIEDKKLFFKSLLI